MGPALGRSDVLRAHADTETRRHGATSIGATGGASSGRGAAGSDSAASVSGPLPVSPRHRATVSVAEWSNLA